ncbi:hypothetical protein EON79_00045 [bacterium]|nr:MAG: hypothetical protein EON79_00045 [bacterium]
MWHDHLMLRYEIPYNMPVKRILPGLLLVSVLGCGGGGSDSGTNPTPRGRAKWTVLVYMNSANDLSNYSDDNVNQMERLAANPDVNFVVQWKKAKGWWDNTPTFTGTRRYLIGHDTSDAIKSRMLQDMGGDVDMGSTETLADFVEWGKANYPSDKVLVVLWDHGTGWQRSVSKPVSRSISDDFATGSKIFAWDLANGFRSKVDVIATDACLMQMVEVGYQLREKCDYFVASEDLVPAAGYPYDRVFASMASRADTSPATFASALATTYASTPESPWNSWSMQQSAVETAKLPALVTALDVFAGALIENRESIATIVTTARDAARAYDPRFRRTYLDLIDVATRIGGSDAPDAVKTAAARVTAAARAAVTANGVNEFGEGGNGIAIDFSPASEFEGTNKEEDYGRLDIAKDSRWDEWLKVAP